MIMIRDLKILCFNFVIRDPKAFYFHFDWPKDADEDLKHEIEFIIKSNEFFSENKTKSKIVQI